MLNQAHPVYSTNPWFLRGAAYSDGVIAGVFAFDNQRGAAFSSVSFRVYITIFKKNRMKER